MGDCPSSVRFQVLRTRKTEEGPTAEDPIEDETDEEELRPLKEEVDRRRKLLQVALEAKLPTA